MSALSNLPAVTVACRIRPRNPKADLPGGFDALFHDDFSVRPADRNTSFTFDAVYGSAASQEVIFNKSIAPLVGVALQGINTTILVYGQTGSGKTFTMSGTREDPGITPRVVDALFRSIEEAPETHEFTLRLSFLEIYKERVRDLLNPSIEASSSLSIRQDAVRGIFVEGATEEYVGSAEELLSIIRLGEANRSVAATGMNDQSSRSHSVVAITLEVRDTLTRSLQVSKISLVDLAGSESVSRTGAEGTTLEEARTINKSLFNLAKCINSLAAMAEEGGGGGGGGGEKQPASASTGDKGASSSSSSTSGGGKDSSSGPSSSSSVNGDGSGNGNNANSGNKTPAPHHIPYRDSKLTRLLQDSLGGNARTALIVCCSPCSSNLTESLSTLRFGTRAKKMKNKPVVNRVRSVEELERMLAKAEIAIDAQSAFIRTLQQQIEELTRAIEGGGGLLQQQHHRTINGSGLGSNLGGEQVIQIFGYADDGTPLGEDGLPLPPDIIALIQQQQQQQGEDGGQMQMQFGESGGGEGGAGLVEAMAITQFGGPSSSHAAVDGDGSFSSSSSFSAGAGGDQPLPSSSPSSSTGAAQSSSLEDGSGGEKKDGSDDPALSLLAGSGGGGATAAHGVASVTAQQILELVALREEVLILRRQRDLDTEELQARAEEIRTLTDTVSSREAEIERITAEKDQAVILSLEQGRLAATSETMEALKGFHCSLCSKRPYEELSDVVGGVTALHEQQCFSLHEVSASLSRVEERAAVLQTEVDDLKGLVATANTKQLELSQQLETANKQLAQRDGPTPSGAGAGAAPSKSDNGSGNSSRRDRDREREVVDVAVMQDLQQKLTNLIMVHRQLLRKYAVVDVECGEMAEGLKARDFRIAEMTRASLAHNATIVSLRDGYEARIQELSSRHQQALTDLRREMLTLQRHHHHVLSGGRLDGATGNSGASASGSGSISPGGTSSGSTSGLNLSGGSGSGSGSASGSGLPFFPLDQLGDGGHGLGVGPTAGAAAAASASTAAAVTAAKQPRNVVKPIKGLAASGGGAMMMGATTTTGWSSNNIGGGAAGAGGAGGGAV